MNPPLYDDATLQSFAGSYGERQVTLENGDLYYQRAGRPKLKMIPMNDNKFMFAEVDYFRIKFIKDSNGTISALEGIYDNGRIDKSERTN